MPKTWAVVLHYRGIEDTRECLRSLAQQSLSDVHSLVVDNSSPHVASRELAEEFPAIEFLRTPANLGWAGANNVGIRRALEAGAERVVLLNNDTIAHPLLLERLDEAGKLRPEFGLLGPVVCDLDAPDRIQTDGFLFDEPSARGFWSRPPAEATPPNLAVAPVVHPRDVVMGCCLWLRREVVERVGLIDERFFLVHEESDFCLRAKEAGFEVGVVAEKLLRHRRSASFEEKARETGRRDQDYYDVRNLALLLRKHAGRRGGGRSRLAAWREYLLHVWYWHSSASEVDDGARARAVAEGFVDGVFGSWGPYEVRRRPTAWLVHKSLGIASRLRQSSQVTVLPPMQTPRS